MNRWTKLTAVLVCITSGILIGINVALLVPQGAFQPSVDYIIFNIFVILIMLVFNFKER